MLVVTRPFGAYRRGDEITDAATEAKTLSGAWRDHVVSVTVAATAKPAPTALEVAIMDGVEAAHPHPAAK